jgi:sporulation protein YlmC with PRC-barrel domain
VKPIFYLPAMASTKKHKMKKQIHMRNPTTSTFIAHSGLALAVVMTLAIWSPVRAQSAEPATKVDIHTVDIHKWKPDSTPGWSVRKLIGKTVKSSKGEDVGEVDNIVLTPDGKVSQLIVSTHGFVGFGEKNLAVKWSDVIIGPGNAYVTTPITAESVKKYGLFDGIAKSSGPIVPRDWRSSELIEGRTTPGSDRQHGCQLRARRGRPCGGLLRLSFLRLSTWARLRPSQRLESGRPVLQPSLRGSRHRQVASVRLRQTIETMPRLNLVKHAVSRTPTANNNETQQRKNYYVNKN